MGQSRFLRQRLVGDVFAVARLKVLHSQCFEIARYGTGSYQLLPDFLLACDRPIDAVAARAGRGNWRNGELPKRIDERFGSLAFDTERECHFRLVFQCYVVRDDVVIDVPEQKFACFGLRIDQQRIFKTENVGVRQNAPLRGQKESVNLFAGFELLNVIGGKRVKQARAIFPGCANASVRG